MSDLTLSKREAQVLQRIADGRLCKQVAADLHITESTVQAHIAKIRKRHRIQGLPAIVAAAIVAAAIRQGLIK